MNAQIETKAIQGRARMLIRKPVAEVFEAIVNPAITAKFWFTKGSARLEKGKRVQWDWEMYGVSAQVQVIEVEPNKRVVVEWTGEGQSPTTVEWLFTARPDNTTYVNVAHGGFRGSVEEIVKQAIDSTSGFSFHLAGLKAWLEHNIELELTRDHHPQG